MHYSIPERVEINGANGIGASILTSKGARAAQSVRQKQLERMIEHLLKTVIQVKLNCRWFGVYNQADATDYLGCF